MKIIKKLLELWLPKQWIKRNLNINVKTIAKIESGWIVRRTTRQLVLYNMDKLLEELNDAYQEDVLDD